MTLKDFKKGSLAQADVKIPAQWQNRKASGHRTLTDLQQNRRRNLPDMSFDLDGDGVVGNRDLVLAKMFDKDGDGKLNAVERAAADEAIRNVSISLLPSDQLSYLSNSIYLREQGIDKKMVWNVDQSGPQRSYRIL